MYFEDEKERSIACYAFENGFEVGFSTSTLPSAKYIYIPLKSYRGIVGVLAFRPGQLKVLLPNQLNFLQTVSQLIANYFERHFREEKEREIKAQIEIDKTYENTLRAIALKLKIPLKNIKESLSELKSVTALDKFLGPINRVQNGLNIIQSISDNAYEMACLSSGFMHFQKEPNDINLIINQACGKLKNELSAFKLKLSIQEDLPLIACDKNLLEICLVSFLKNSIGNAPISTTIEIEAKNQTNLFILAVIDEGPGIPESLKKEVFNKFYSIPGSNSSGLGLGLSIAKSIATLHNATIEVVNQPQRGLRVSLIMPI
jgi:two-component system sensor histidine kinase KdpD